VNIADCINALGRPDNAKRDDAVLWLLDVPADAVDHLTTAVYLSPELARSNAASVMGWTRLREAARPLLAWTYWEKQRAIRGNLAVSLSLLWECGRPDFVDDAQDEFMEHPESWAAKVVGALEPHHGLRGFQAGMLKDLHLLTRLERPTFDAQGHLTGLTTISRGSHSTRGGGGDCGRSRKVGLRGQYEEVPAWQWDNHGNIVWIHRVAV